MAGKKESGKSEPLLSAMARTLGSAAGKITKATQEWKENIAAMPEAISAKIGSSAASGVVVKSPGEKIQNAGKKKSVVKKTSLKKNIAARKGRISPKKSASKKKVAVKRVKRSAGR